MQEHRDPERLDSSSDPQAESPERPQQPRDAKLDADLAHEFGNLAMSILSAANLLQRFGHDPERVARIAILLRETGERAIATSRRLRP
jgi:hypothetical protein